MSIKQLFLGRSANRRDVFISTERTSAGARGWRTIASSADGTKLVAVVNNGYIYTITK